MKQTHNQLIDRFDNRMQFRLSKLSVYFIFLTFLIAISAIQSYAQTPAVATAAKAVPLSVPIDSNWSSSNGQEYPGATVKFTVIPDGYKPGVPAAEMVGDFTGGGAYCCAGRSIGDLNADGASTINMLVKSTNINNVSVRVVDGTGQTHQAKNIKIVPDGQWHTLTLQPTSIAGGEHWGGDNDGVWHGPLTEFYILTGPASGPTKMPSLYLADVTVDVPAPVVPIPVVVTVNAVEPFGTPIVTQARRVSDFLDSIGADSAIDSRGEDLAHTIKCAQYVGIRWFRAGIEGGMPITTFATAYKQAGIRFDWCIGSAGDDLPKLLSTARALQAAAPGALLSFEGPNEPNNWGVTYNGEKGGGNSGTWMPIAKLQSDMYTQVKADPALHNIPVWGISETGAESDNVGLQFLTIPAGAGCLMPAGTKFADYANVHNYIYHQNSPNVEDNKTWNAADPSPACKVDGLYGEYGVTWGKHFIGYDLDQLQTLPRVTTETGTTIGGQVTEEIHGLNLLSMYLDQFKRGWSYTAVYLLRDRVDEAGNQKFGFYRPNYTPRLAAVYLHNLTTILADSGTSQTTHPFGLATIDMPPTVHNMLLQKSNGTYDLLVWGEKVTGSDTFNINFGPSIKLANVYDPTVGTEPLKSISNFQSIKLTLTDHPVIIEIPGK